MLPRVRAVATITVFLSSNESLWRHSDVQWTLTCNSSVIVWQEVLFPLMIRRISVTSHIRVRFHLIPCSQALSYSLARLDTGRGSSFNIVEHLSRLKKHNHTWPHVTATTP